MKRVLFVDDEANVLDGLRRMLRPQRKDWEMVFVMGGREALEAAAACPFDVIVTDMRMPGMDGAALLKHFHDAYPQTVRFILSGHAELQSVMRTVPIAHQFLSKPCDADELREAVVRACEMRALLHNERVAAVVGSLDGLPSRPETYTAILEAIANPDADVRAIVAILESDVAMTAKLLQLVNSAFFGLPQKCSDLLRAVSHLGLNTLRDLVLSIEVFRPPSEGGEELRKIFRELETHSMWTAHIARLLVTDKQMRNNAFTAGMLHDIGRIVITTQLPHVALEATLLCRSLRRPLHVVEEELLGISHAEIGAYLLGVWGLPYPILEAAAYHHRPMVLTQRVFSELTAVHVADALVDARLSGGADGSGIDLAYLECLGVRDRLDEWEERATQELSDRGGDGQ